MWISYWASHPAVAAQMQAAVDVRCCRLATPPPVNQSVEFLQHVLLGWFLSLNESGVVLTLSPAGEQSLFVFWPYGPISGVTTPQSLQDTHSFLGLSVWVCECNDLREQPTHLTLPPVASYIDEAHACLEYKYFLFCFCFSVFSCFNTHSNTDTQTHTQTQCYMEM